MPSQIQSHQPQAFPSPTTRSLVLDYRRRRAAMVRVKHRYLLVHILCPEDTSPYSVPNLSSLPSVVQFKPPTPDAVTAKTLLRLIREQLELLFGDHGAANAGSTLKSQCHSSHVSYGSVGLTDTTL